MKKDFIALGEISKSDVEYIRSICQLEGYELKTGVCKVGRTSFDTCFIYNTSKVFVLDMSNITSFKGNSELRIAQKLELLIESSSSLIYLFVSHWPSRLWCHENHVNRDLFGIRLRDSIEEIFKNNSNPHIILLGDYNDEPFNRSLSEHVMATRDRNLVSKRKHLLYNPFWKQMGPNLKDMYSCGSYFYKSGGITQWHTFDQMIFSHAFINAKEWSLNDSSEYILHIPNYLKLVTDVDKIFDHLPVIGEIERMV